MAYLKTYSKTPSEFLSFDVPFAKAIALDDGAGGIAADPIVSFTCGCDAGIVVFSAGIFNAISVRLWVLGGQNGRYYTAWAEVTTQAGRIKRGEVRLRVRGANLVVVGGPVIPPLALALDGGALFLDGALLVFTTPTLVTAP